MSGCVENTVRASLTKAGQEAALTLTYQPPGIRAYTGPPAEEGAPPVKTVTEVPAEIARPWLAAKPESWWLITGTDGNSTFQDCTARVLPEHITGHRRGEPGEPPLFELLLYSGPRPPVQAQDITRAREIVMVWADDPHQAVHAEDQVFLNAAPDRAGHR